MAEGFDDRREAFKAMKKSAFIVGYTGEIGKELVKELAASNVFSRLVLIGRRKVEYTDELLKNLEQQVVDFDNLDQHADVFKGLDVGFCSLGTTRRKAGADGFYKVDHDYVVNTARVAKANGCQHFQLVTAAGANKDSYLLYNRAKGEVEEEIKAMGFNRFSIYRPALLLCDRQESRFGEKAITILLKPVTAAFPTALSVPTVSVAQAMVNCLFSSAENNAVEIFDNKGIHLLAKVSNPTTKDSKGAKSPEAKTPTS